MTRRFVLAGAPGSGKTSIAHVLKRRGYPVIEEAATDVIAELLAAGNGYPWFDEDFLDRIAIEQGDRQRNAAGNDAVQIYDRSPLCTWALSRYIGRSITPGLAAEVHRMLSEPIYERQVFFVRPLGYLVRTHARDISYEDALFFETIHERAYRDHGFELIDIPAGGTPEERASLVEGAIGAG
jgi:predicted ATPase